MYRMSIDQFRFLRDTILPICERSHRTNKNRNISVSVIIMLLLTVLPRRISRETVILVVKKGMVEKNTDRHDGVL